MFIEKLTNAIDIDQALGKKVYCLIALSIGAV